MDENKLCGKSLTFGDKDQIEAINNAPEEMFKKYRITYYIEGQIEIEVEAESEDEAKKLAQQELDDMSAYDIRDSYEIEYGCINEIKIGE